MFIPLLLIFSSFLLVAFYNFHWKRRKLPPGPTPWPILGNLVEVAKDKTNFQIFRKWADQFGPIYTAWWAEEPYIIITDYQLMKDAYVKQAEAFSGRHLLPISNILSEANHSAGVARINGESWRELRKFSMKLLRDLGVGRNGMQERILPTVKAIVRKLDTDLSNDIAEFNMLPFFNFFTANVINELTFATGFDGNNHHHYEQLMHLSETIHSNFTSIFGLLLALIPPLRHLPFFKNTFNKMNGPWEAFHAYFEQGIQQRIAHRQAMGGGQRRYSVVRKRSGSIEAAMAAIRKRSGSGGAAANGMRSRKQSNEMQQIQKKMSGAGPVKKKSSIAKILKQTQNMQQGMANSKENLGETTGEIGGGGGGGVFQKPMRKFSSTAVGRKVSRMQWTVVVEREQTPSECFVDLFLDKLDQQGPDKFFNMDSLRGMCFDLFVGGQEPTASTLGFMTIYMLMDQQRQKKLHAEMDAFALEKGWNGEFEEDEWIGLADRPKLPYLNAVINETQRIVNILPMNLTHQTTCEAQIGDFLLPKGIAVVSQISSIFYDPKLFPEPEKFIPERFIDENGQLKKCEELVPFSLGKRNCIGEGLARAELFLFAANFFNKFHVLPADPLRPPSIEKKIYFTAMPLPYRCCLVRRKHLLPPPPCSPRSPLFFKEEAGSVELQLPCSSGNNSDDDFVPVFPILPPVPPKKGWAVEKEKENAPEEGDWAKNEGEELANPAAKLLDPKDIEEPSKAMAPKKRNNSIRKNGIFTPPQSPQHQQQQQMLIGGKMEEDGAKKGRN